jgi:histidinol-phosphatase
MDDRDLRDALAFALELADVARDLTLAGFGGRLAVELKDDRTPVTEIDVAAERAIRAAIAERSPDDGVLGEEGGSTPSVNGRTWVLDPIDGTKLYAEGIPLWTTLIALREDDRVVVGVADAPALGDRYHATLGGGAWRGPERLHVSGVDSLADAFVVHSPVEEWLGGAHAARFAGLATSARDTRGLSDAWAQVLVAQGSVDAYVELARCFEWDWAATGLIVEEAGGRLTTFEGGRPMAGTGLVVSNGVVHEQMLAILDGTTED